MRILVTGGAGFVGSEYVRMLLGSLPGRPASPPMPTPTMVTVLDKLTYSGNLANLAPVWENSKLRFVLGDICDPAVVDDTVAGQDVIVHFAAESHVDRSITSAQPFVTTNVLGTQTLLDAALRHGTSRFLHVSTDEVYGSIDDGSWTEASHLAPNSAYSASKAGSDLLALSYHRTHGMDIVVTRCSNNYGPYQFPEKLIPLFVTNLLEGRDVPLYGDGENVRGWLHVRDHCRGIALVQQRGRSGETYHIGGGTELTNRELTGRMLKACDVGWDRVVSVADRKGHDRRYALDFTKISDELGYTPTVDFDSGLAETVQWYRDNAVWWKPLKSGPAA